jgi:transcriptional regulator with XRE-family HTH domain
MCIIYVDKNRVKDKLYEVTKASNAADRLPPATRAAIEKLGADLAVARLRRGESQRTWAKRMGVSTPTLQRLEAGDPGISLGILATALFLINKDGQLSKLAAPESDQGAIELSVQEAIDLGKRRALASAEARLKRSRSAPAERGRR